MKYRNLEVIVLGRDIPHYGLKAGHQGTVIEILPGCGLEIEFQRGMGKTSTLVTLTERDIRKLDSQKTVIDRHLTEVS